MHGGTMLVDVITLACSARSLLSVDEAGDDRT